MREDRIQAVTRRQFFQNCLTGMGSVALASLIDDRLLAAPASSNDALALKPSHFPAKCKNVIFLHMVGAPSQLDLFDYKPALQKHNGQPIPKEIVEGERFAFIRGEPILLGSPYEFSKHGQSGAEISELLPNIASIADDLCIIRSLHTEEFNHGPAQLKVHTGFGQPGRPSMGSWVTYGLGSENRNLPGFVVLISGNQPAAGNSCWGNGYLPSVYQGVEFRSQGDPVLFISNPPGMSGDDRRQTVDAINDLNQIRLGEAGDPEISTRIAQYEMAYRMQSSVPELADIAGESKTTLEMYGVEEGKVSFANNCLLARRLVERGVRFVQLYDWGWDSHGTSKGDDIVHSLKERCTSTDQAVAALVKDLKQRGLLEETLVVWGGEFGRTPMNEARNGSKFLGRDHHPRAFTVWMAGGGVKPGVTYGATDELGYSPAENPVHVHDLQATILHLLGMDHKRLTYRFQGRDFRLTDVHGEVVHGVVV